MYYFCAMSVFWYSYSAVLAATHNITASSGVSQLNYIQIAPAGLKTARSFRPFANIFFNEDNHYQKQPLRLLKQQFIPYGM